MKRALPMILLAFLYSTVSLADWDPELEAQEEAERQAELRVQEQQRREIQNRQRELQAKTEKATMDSKRKALGAAADGKADAEVNRLYDAKIKSDMASAAHDVQSARNALSQGKGANAVKEVTGKSMEKLETLSDEEAEALSRELEKQYGQ